MVRNTKCALSVEMFQLVNTDILTSWNLPQV